MLFFFYFFIVLIYYGCILRSTRLCLIKINILKLAFIIIWNKIYNTMNKISIMSSTDLAYNIYISFFNFIVFIMVLKDFFHVLNHFIYHYIVRCISLTVLHFHYISSIWHVNWRKIHYCPTDYISDQKFRMLSISMIMFTRSTSLYMSANHLPVKFSEVWVKG